MTLPLTIALALISASRRSRGEKSESRAGASLMSLAGAALLSVTRPQPIRAALALALAAANRRGALRQCPHKPARRHLGDACDQLVLHPGNGDDLAGLDVIQTVTDQSVGLEPHDLGQLGRLSVG